MRLVRTVAVMMGVVCMCLRLGAQAPVYPGAQAASVQVQQMRLDRVQPDRLIFSADVELMPARSITVRELSFAAMRVNGMPVYVSPLTERIAMKKGEPVDLPPLEIVVYSRDLTSVQPIRDAVAREEISVAGQIAATIDGSLLEDLFFHALHPKIVLPFTTELPLQVPGGDAGRTAALAALDLMAPLSPLATTLLGVVAPGQDAAWRNDLMENGIGHMLLVRTNYLVVEGNTTYPVEFVQLGFWTGRSTAVVPAEAVAPWEFDPEIQARMEANHAHVDPASMQITAEPMRGWSAADASSGGGGPAWSFAAGDFRIETGGRPPESRVPFAARGIAVKVRERTSPGNYALLRFRQGIIGDPIPLTWPRSGGENRLAVFRLVRDPAADRVRAEVVFLPGTVQGQQVRLDEPIDDSAFGSPVMTKEGALAMLQDETAAMLLSSVKDLEVPMP